MLDREENTKREEKEEVIYIESIIHDELYIYMMICSSIYSSTR